MAEGQWDMEELGGRRDVREQERNRRGQGEKGKRGRGGRRGQEAGQKVEKRKIGSKVWKFEKEIDERNAFKRETYFNCYSNANHFFICNS